MDNPLAEDLSSQEADIKPENNKKTPKQNGAKPKRKKKKSIWLWSITITLITLLLTFIFSLSSELLLSGAGIAVSVLIIVFLWITTFTADMIGIAATSASEEPFVAMCSRRIRGAKEALFIVKHAEKVSNITVDAIGDLTGVISGAVGAAIVAKIIIGGNLDPSFIWVMGAVTALIASVTVFGKAVLKKYAFKNSTRVLMILGKFMSLFTKKQK